MTSFDETSTPTFLDQPHIFSIDTQIPHSQQLDIFSPEVQTSGTWIERRLRGTATRYLTSDEQGAQIQVSFVGSAVSALMPMEFTPPGPRYGTLGGTLRCRIDGSSWLNISRDRGREVIVGTNLSAGTHNLEIECCDLSAGPCGIEAIRVWHAVIPNTVFGKINSDALLTDLRADVSGPVQFSRTIRNARTGFFSLILPLPGTYQIDLQATGWKPHTFNVTIANPGEVIELPDIALSPQELTSTPPRNLNDNEPLILICFAHANIWGQESAEWLSRRVNWINSQKPHAVLDANEVNPRYVAGALHELQCPWITCSGNHSMPAFDSGLPAKNRDLALSPARFLTAGKEIEDDIPWEQTLSQFTEQDRLRIVCSYEPYAPSLLLKHHQIRFFFYGHNRLEGCLLNRNGTTFLRKVDANTFYRVEIGPPHDFSAPIKIERFIFQRDADTAS
ncbi:MAG: hypothetical protein QGG64_24850 [Candidatus Latescibacteria bacterium]|jgi:hypothetical protein|nr:hypothetical protein [Candidatus Latescibacterota bacterium]